MYGLVDMALTPGQVERVKFAVEYRIYREVKVLLCSVLDNFKQALTSLLEIKGHTVP